MQAERPHTRPEDPGAEKPHRLPEDPQAGEPHRLPEDLQAGGPHRPPEDLQAGEPHSQVRELLPGEFLQRMQALLPENEYQAFLSSYGRKRLFSLRINPLKCPREHFLGLAEPWLQAQTEPGAAALLPVPWEPDGFYYPEELRPGRHPRHEAGMYYIQEASAMAPAMLCGARPGDRVLDLCAAPGGKSTKLAACLQGQGVLVANEIHPDRAKILASNLERTGVRNAVVTSETPRRLASRFPLFFDRIVVDAPCSGEGMFRKEEAALAQWSLENIQLCARRQREILEEAETMLRPGGILVYSTCTFAPEENEDMIRWFLKEHPDFSLIDIAGLPGVDMEAWGFASGNLPGTVRLWPHRLRGEGHFAALLRKKGRAETGGGPGRETEAEAWRDQSDGRKEKVETARAGERSLQYTVGRETEAGAARGRASVRQTYEEAFHGGAGGRKKEKKKGRNQGGDRKKKADQGLAEALRLWTGFKEDALVFPGPASAPDRPETGTASAGAPAWTVQEDRLLLFGDSLYACPVPRGSLSLDGLRVLSPGLQLGTLKKGRFVPAHALGMALHREEVQRFVDFAGESPAASAWIRGEAIPVGEERENGWTLVLIDGCAAGWGKVSGGILKNHYPKGLRKRTLSM